MRTEFSRFITLALVSLVIYVPKALATDVSGILSSDTTWSLSDSPYSVTGDIQIPSGVKLTIESGVVVQFEGAYEILVKGSVAVNGTEAQPVTFQSPTEGTSSEATVFHFKETDLSLSSMSHVKFSDSTYAIRIGGESNFNTLDIDTVEIKNAEVRADTHNVTQKASGGDSSKAKGKVVLDNVTLDTATIRTSYPWSEEIDVKNGTAVDSLMYVSDYGGKLTTENMTVSNSKYYIGCCDSYLDIKNSTLLASSLNGRNGTTLIQNSRLIGTPIRLNENYGSLTIEDSVIEYNTESRTFQGGWDSSSYAGEYGIKAGTTIDIKRSTIKGPGSGIGINVQSSNRDITIKDSIFMGTDKAIQVNGTYSDYNTIEITGNNFSGNSEYVIENLTTKNITATGNYWGSSDESAIKASIFDYLDNINYGVVDYSGNLSAASTSVSPAPPANLSGQTGQTTMELSWTANAESDIAGYKVYYDTDGSGYPYANSVITGSTSALYTLTGLTTGTTYYVAIAAVDSDGNESWISNEFFGSAGTTVDVTKLVILDYPITVYNEVNFQSEVIVALADSNGNYVNDDSVSVSLSIKDFESSSVLNGTTTAQASSGFAKFTNLNISGSGTGSISAEADGFSSVSTVNFTISSTESVEGPKWSDTTWSLSDSPYSVTGDVQIPSGVKLTIESGVVVQFEGAYEILVKGLVAVNGTEAQPVTFQSPTEGTSSEATVFHFKETDLSLSSMSHVKFSDSTYAIRIGGESNFNTLDIDTVEIKNAEVRADTHNVTQKASGGDSSKTKGKVVLDNVTLDTVTIRTSYPWSEEIDVKNGTAVDSLMYVSDYGGKLTTENMTVSNSKYYIGCCDSYLDIKNSTLLASSLNGRNGTTLIQNSRLIGTPIRLNENYGSLTIEDSVIEYNTESRTFQGGWDSSSYAGEYGIKAGTTIDIKRSTIKGPGSGIGINVQSSNRDITIKDSIFMGTDKAIQVNGTYSDYNTIEITGNNFSGNSEYVIENLTTKNITATGNYWGSSDESAIKASIFDYLDDIDYGVVDYSGNLSATGTSPPPSPPANLAGQAGPTTMQLSWTANSESDIAGYKVYYDTDGSGYPYANSVSTGSTGTTYTLTGLTTGTTYYTAVAAIDSDGNESWISAEVSGTAASTPTDLALTAQPSNANAGSPLSSQPVVRVTDLEGNLVTSSSPSVTVSITSGSGTSGATLLGTTTVSAVDGVATFSDLQINSAGTDYTLTVSSSGLTILVSSAFDIAAGPASTLVVAIDPSESAANDAFSTQPVVHIKDDYGNIITTATGTVTATIISGLGTLTGTASVAASAGVATFTGLGIDTKGDDYQLGFSSTGLTSATSTAFNIISATPVSLSFTSNITPTGGQAGEASALASTVMVLDKNGNKVLDSSAEITLEITDDTGNDEGELSGTVTLNAINGQAVFGDASINLAANNYSVTATSSGLTEAVSSTFNITAGSPVALGFVTEPGGGQTGRPLGTQPVVGFVDSQGNAVAVDNGISISVAIKSGTGFFSGNPVRNHYGVD